MRTYFKSCVEMHSSCVKEQLRYDRFFILLDVRLLSLGQSSLRLFELQTAVDELLWKIVQTPIALKSCRRELLLFTRIPLSFVVQAYIQ